MGRRFVVGTAGHIDHGKTALVKALTGVDTDRWEEEKRRGITIDLGFAPLPLGDDVQASIVDVPGHEGFVKNMLAGATGIDLALLVIAADEGVMPQTEEHLAIVELLGVRRGIPVITKRDAVDADWLDLVQGDVVSRLASSRVVWAPPVVTSAVTGEGLEDLRAALRRAAAELVERPAEDHFRLPIDRVFAVAGAGTVVTGSTWSGTVAAGDTVRLMPQGHEVRVRSIEVHGQPAGRAEPGQRTALALVGVDKADLARGHVAVTGSGWTASRAVDAAVELLPTARRAIGSRTRVRVHLGTEEVLARVAHGREIQPGERGIARLLLERPLVARGGDRFVLRSYSPVTTIGGGVVLDPFPPQRPRLRERRLGADQAPAARLVVWIEEAGLEGIRVTDLPVRLGVLPGSVTEVIAQAGDPVLQSGDILVLREAVAGGAARLAEALDRYHEDHPLDPGMSLQALRAVLPAGTPAAVADLAVDMGVRQGAIQVEGSIARRARWRPRFECGAGEARGRLASRISGARWQIPTRTELEREFPGLPVPALLAQLVREGGVEQVDQERVASGEALREFSRALETTLRELGAATPAQLRDRLGLTRKYLIPLLEWSDRRGITRRQGDARTLTRLTSGSAGA